MTWNHTISKNFVTIPSGAKCLFCQTQGSADDPLIHCGECARYPTFMKALRAGCFWYYHPRCMNHMTICPGHRCHETGKDVSGDAPRTVCKNHPFCLNVCAGGQSDYLCRQCHTEQGVTTQ